MEEFAKFVVGLLVTILLGTTVPVLVGRTIPQPRKPTGFKGDDWNAIFEHYDAGGSIGFLERFLSLVVFWLPEPNVLIAWLAFKVAAKWESWKNIVQVPKDIKGYSPLASFRVRKTLGSWLLTRFLVGTLANILIGAAGAYTGKVSLTLVAWACSILA